MIEIVEAVAIVNLHVQAPARWSCQPKYVKEPARLFAFLRKDFFLVGLVQATPSLHLKRVVLHFCCNAKQEVEHIYKSINSSTRRTTQPYSPYCVDFLIQVIIVSCLIVIIKSHLQFAVTVKT